MVQGLTGGSDKSSDFSQVPQPGAHGTDEDLPRGCAGDRILEGQHLSFEKANVN